MSSTSGWSRRFARYPASKSHRRLLQVRPRFADDGQFAPAMCLADSTTRGINEGVELKVNYVNAVSARTGIGLGDTNRHQIVSNQFLFGR